jgi:hypothetical protein
LFSDIIAVDNGVTAAQLFVGCHSIATEDYRLKTNKKFVNTLEDNIRKWGSMDNLISSCDKA